MATTTNYGWVTPDDTDLVKDGAAAIRTLGTSVDTSFVDLLGGTTGQVLTKASSTDLDFTFATPAGGGSTLLSTTTLSGASTTISGISQNFLHLYLVLHGATYSVNVGNLRIAPNGVTDKVFFTGTANGALSGYNASFARFYETIVNDHTSANNVLNLQIFDYTSSTARKNMFANNIYTTSSGVRPECYQGGFDSTTAVTSLVFSLASGTFTTGTVLLYGVK